MKVYLYIFNGHYIGGSMVIVDDTKRKAFNQAKKSLVEAGLFEKNADMKIDDLVEIETDKRSIEVISDGDY